MEQKRVEVMNSVDFNTAQNFSYRLGACKLDAAEMANQVLYHSFPDYRQATTEGESGEDRTPTCKLQSPQRHQWDSCTCPVSSGHDPSRRTNSIPQRGYIYRA
jgi:hypothetical protein